MRIAATVAAAAGSLTCVAITRRMPARTRAAASSHHGPGVASTIDAVLMVANRRSPLRASARSASGTPKLRYGNGRRTEANVARTTRPRVQARRAASAESPRTVARTPSGRGDPRTGPRHARHVEVESDATTGRHPCVVTQDAIDLQAPRPRAVACSMATRSTPGGAQRRASARVPIATPTPAAAVAAAIRRRGHAPPTPVAPQTMTMPTPSTRMRAAVSGGSGTAPLTRQPRSKASTQEASGDTRHQ